MQAVTASCSGIQDRKTVAQGCAGVRVEAYGKYYCAAS